MKKKKKKKKKIKNLIFFFVVLLEPKNAKVEKSAPIDRYRHKIFPLFFFPSFSFFLSYFVCFFFHVLF